MRHISQRIDRILCMNMVDSRDEIEAHKADLVTTVTSDETTHGKSDDWQSFPL